jgi:hypothetical protein
LSKERSDFKARNADRAFRSKSRKIIESLTIREGFSLLMDFYCKNRALGATSIDDDGDQLLFQWGSFDWGQGENFEVNLTRQIILPDGDDDFEIWQLSLTYGCPTTKEWASLGGGNKWCDRPEQLQSFQSFVLESQPVLTLENEPNPFVDLCWERT